MCITLKYLPMIDDNTSEKQIVSRSLSGYVTANLLYKQISFTSKDYDYIVERTKIKEAMKKVNNEMHKPEVRAVFNRLKYKWFII